MLDKSNLTSLVKSLVFIFVVSGSSSFAMSIEKLTDDSVKLTGEITLASPSEIQKFLVDNIPFNQISGLEIQLASPGGHTGAAYQITAFMKWLSSKGLPITIKTNENWLCASACIMLLASGDKLELHPNTRLVFHAASFGENNSVDNSVMNETKTLYIETIRDGLPDLANWIENLNLTSGEGEHLFMVKDIPALSSYIRQ